MGRGTPSTYRAYCDGVNDCTDFGIKDGRDCYWVRLSIISFNFALTTRNVIFVAAKHVRFISSPNLYTNAIHQHTVLLTSQFIPNSSALKKRLTRFHCEYHILTAIRYQQQVLLPRSAEIVTRWSLVVKLKVQIWRRIGRGRLCHAILMNQSHNC